jgi:hypothetical protein
MAMTQRELCKCTIPLHRLIQASHVYGIIYIYTRYHIYIYIYIYMYIYMYTIIYIYTYNPNIYLRIWIPKIPWSIIISSWKRLLLWWPVWPVVVSDSVSAVGDRLTIVSTLMVCWFLFGEGLLIHCCLSLHCCWLISILLGKYINFWEHFPKHCHGNDAFQHHLAIHIGYSEPADDPMSYNLQKPHTLHISFPTGCSPHFCWSPFSEDT